VIERVRRDPFFCGTVLVALWLAGLFLGVTWYIFRDPYSLGGTVLAVGAAIALLRPSPANRPLRR